MATEQTSFPMNGDYAPHGGHYATSAEQHLSSQSHGNNAAASAPAPGAFGSQNANVPSSAGGTTGGSHAHAEIPKDEVGWYFVEQYYTNLSRSPDKLHLFYSKRSQLVSGLEAEKVQVSVGRTAISERIKELEFQDCKVRVSNVDSQSSFDNIVIQVIGEMSNKSAPHRKFVQTFVLAEQPNGYFVLNDIFRYINDDEEEEDAEGERYQEGAAELKNHQGERNATGDAQGLTSSSDPAQQRHDANRVDKQLEQKVLKEEVSAPQRAVVDESTPVPTTNGTTAGEVKAPPAADGGPADAAPAPDDATSPAPADAESSAKAEDEQTETPKDPAPSPAPAPETPTKPAAAPQAPMAAPPKPSVPKTWANMVAATKSTDKAAPSSTSSTPPASAQTKPPPPSSQTSENTSPPAQQGSGSGWQTAGNDHTKRQARPQSISGVGEKETIMAYVKNVTDKVPTDALRSALHNFGELAYFDISRPKNCAFVEFANIAGYTAAVAANPHQIGGEQIYVEERRPRSGAYGGAGYNAGRGGAGRGRGGLDGRPSSQGRGGLQKDGGRGGYGTARGRGGNNTPRGRAGPPPS
ncbi:MAG: hypothetical protein M1837_002788 [Sclerophora amabilis]|nr:MAG: hypothetical protein M1837_002788 [Sclerophora amabilis]